MAQMLDHSGQKDGKAPSLLKSNGAIYLLMEVPDFV